MKTGTNHFPSFAAALRYYAPQVETPVIRGAIQNRHTRHRIDPLIEEVEAKIKLGEIEIGKPDIRPGQKLIIQDNRYFIEE